MTATAAPGRRHLRLRWLVAAAVVLIVAWLVWCALLTLRAVHQLQQGQSAVTQVRGEVSTADLADNRAAPALDRAAVEFAAAHRNLDSGWLVPLHVLPYAGRQLRAANALSGAATSVADAGRVALGQAHTLLQAPHQTPEQRTVVVGRLATTLATLRGHIDHLDLGPANALLPALAKKRNIFVADLAKVQSAVDRGGAAATAATDLLSGPHTYLVLTANNAEMRAGSGMFLQAGILHTDGGRLDLGSFVSTGDLSSSTPLAPLTGDLAARWGQQKPNQEWRNLALSPDFPANARLAAAMWEHQRSQQVDGVLVLDVAAEQDLIGVTGPVDVNGMSVSADTVERYLLRDQYAGATSDAANTARRESLGSLASATFRALQQGGLALPKLATALTDAVNGRHLLIWSANATREAQWRSAGVSGQLPPEGLLLAVMNRGGNKLDPYQAVTTQLDVRPQGGNSLVHVTATIRDQQPSGLPPYVLGTGGPSAGVYTGVAALDFPSFAGYASMSGGQTEVSAGPDGPTTVLATNVVVPNGASTTVTWQFTLLGHHGRLRVAPGARVPPASWTATVPGGPERTFTDAEAHTVSW